MNKLGLFLVPLFSILIFCGCNNDDDVQDGNYVTENKMRVKRMEGENAHWGKYILEFNYRADGRLENAIRLNPNVADQRDTVGIFQVEYDNDFHEFKIYDIVLRIDADSVNKLQQLYPTTYQDTLLKRRTSVLYYSTKLENGQFMTRIYRPKRSNGSGEEYNPSYVNVFGQTQMLEETKEGLPLVVRCYDDVYKSGGENDEYNRTVMKYEFMYEGNEMNMGILSQPNSYSESSWIKLKERKFSNYSGVLVGVDSDFYKMRRSGDKVVVAEPGKNITYTLNEAGMAVKLETTDGETAVISYESGGGNFSELYATPLDHVLGKVWIK